MEFKQPVTYQEPVVEYGILYLPSYITAWGPYRNFLILGDILKHGAGIIDITQTNHKDIPDIIKIELHMLIEGNPTIDLSKNFGILLTAQDGKQQAIFPYNDPNKFTV